MSIIWSPLPGGSPRVKGNFPGNYWPGSRWVDWASTDFYSQYPVWKDLNRFYAGKQWKGKPIAIAEWAVHGSDDPRFAKQLISWVVKRPRVRMFVYYDGFGTSGNTYDLGLYPRTANTLRLKVRRANFLQYAEYNAGLPTAAEKSQNPDPRADSGPGADSDARRTAPAADRRTAPGHSVNARGPASAGPLGKQLACRGEDTGLVTSSRPCPAYRRRAFRRRRRPPRAARR